jgi:CheY-like chemotaxis protein
MGGALSVDDVVSVLDALQGFVWPAVAVWLLWRLLPAIRRVIESRRFDVEVAGMKISVQEAIDQLPRQIADLQQRVARQLPASPLDATARTVPGTRHVGDKRLLWVDDRPTANVFEMKTLEDEGWTIDRATTTSEALRTAAGDWDRYALVISDMGRQEEHGYVPTAGIELASGLEREAPEVPLAIYTGGSGLKLTATALDAGAQLVTSSPSALLQFVRTVAPDRPSG